MIFIKTGDRGDKVKKIQEILTTLGYPLIVDGIFGPQTERAVKLFQVRNALTIDGIVGPDTYEQLLLSIGTPKIIARVNSREYFSKTPDFIYVKLDEFMVYIFKGRMHEWTLVRQVLATIGKPETPTVTGIFSVRAKGAGYTKEFFKVKWYTQFFKNYLFHSILYNFDDTVFDGRLGAALSDGCIRPSEADAKYIYDFIPYGTLVVIE